jgi:hypothetical protein
VGLQLHFELPIYFSVEYFEAILLAILLVVTGIIGGYALVHLTWRIFSVIRLKTQKQSGHGPRGNPVLWRDPGEVEKLDLFHGAGGPLGIPVPPFHFLKEHDSGSSPCVSIGDARQRIWRIKWGTEVNTENFCTRIAWACGYFVETTYFLDEGKIQNVPAELIAPANVSMSKVIFKTHDLSSMSKMLRSFLMRRAGHGMKIHS